MKVRYFLIGVVVFFSTITHVVPAAAISLGLAPGNYNIAIDMPGTVLDMTGTLTIGPAFVTQFDVAGTATIGHWQCTSGCLAGIITSLDEVGINASNIFQISDNGGTPTPTNNNLILTSSNLADLTTSAGATLGTWGATPVPEPSALALLTLGLLALCVRRWQLS